MDNDILKSLGLTRILTNETDKFNGNRIEFWGSLYEIEHKGVTTEYAVMDHEMRNQLAFFKRDSRDDPFKRTAFIPRILIEYVYIHGLERTTWSTSLQAVTS